jgi:outer membrane lipoprotein-sorting protein
LPGIDDVLKKVTNTYHDVTEYELVRVVRSSGPVNSAETHIAFRAPDKYRVELKADKVLAAPRSPLATNDVFDIFDGLTMWEYRPALHIYSKFLNRPPKDMSPDEVDRNVGIGVFRNFADTHKSSGGAPARVLRETRFTLNGRTCDCVVVEAPSPEGVLTYWVDQQSWQVLRVQMASRFANADMLFPVIKLNEPQPEKLFHFKPPPGAHLR